MKLNKILKNVFLVVMVSLIVTACATKKSVQTKTEPAKTKEAETQKADPIEKKLIKRIKEQVEQGKIVLSMRSKEKV